MKRVPREALRPLVDAAQLVSVDLVKGDYARVVEAEAPMSTPRSLDVKVNVNVARRSQYDEGMISFLCSAVASWIVADGENAIANAGAMFRIVYRLKGIDRSLSDAEVFTFGDEVALHHAWPFLREKLKSYSVDLGLPPLLLPLQRPKMGEGKT